MHAGEEGGLIGCFCATKGAHLPHSHRANRMSVKDWPLRDAELSGSVFRDDIGASVPKGPAGVFRLKRDNRPGKSSAWVRDAGEAKGAQRGVQQSDGSWKRDHNAEAANRSSGVQQPDGSWKRDHNAEAANRSSGVQQPDGSWKRNYQAEAANHTTNQQERDAAYLKRHPEQGSRRDTKHSGDSNNVKPLFSVEPAKSIINISSQGAGLAGINAGRVALEVETAILDGTFSHRYSKESITIIDRSNDQLLNSFELHSPQGLSHNVDCFQTLLKMTDGKEGETVGYVTDCEIYQSPSEGPRHPNEGEKFEWSLYGFDSFGNITCKVFNYWHPKHAATDPPGSVVTAQEDAEAIEHLKRLRDAGSPVLSTGNPELRDFRRAGMRASDTRIHSTGFDFQPAVLTVFPTFRHDPNSANPFSISQNMLVPCNGIRRKPKHQAKSDCFDEAVCVMGLMRALRRRPKL